jgi:hypothetical protein
VNWDLATKIGVQEETLLPEFKVYEHAIAVADVLVGWIYGIAAVGLILDESWAYKLIWIPGAILVYHSLSCWVWLWNQSRMGYQSLSSSFRLVWFLLNFITGILAILIAWQ